MTPANGGLSARAVLSRVVWSVLIGVVVTSLGFFLAFAWTRKPPKQVAPDTIDMSFDDPIFYAIGAVFLGALVGAALGGVVAWLSILVRVNRDTRRASADMARRSGS